MRGPLLLCAPLLLTLHLRCSVYDESLLPNASGGAATGAADSGGATGGGLTGGGGFIDTGGTGGATGGGTGGIGGTGGNVPTGGTGGTDAPTCDPTPHAGPREYVIISDMEAQATTSSPIDLPGGGYWFTAAQELTCIAPIGNIMSEELEEPRPRDEDQGGGDSEHAMHFIGTDCVEWGASAGFRLQQAGAYNACEFDGIAFWARLGNVDSATTLQVEIPDVNTDPSGGRCDIDPASSDQCHAYHFRNITLSDDPEEWTFYELPFSSFSQPNWGLRAGDLTVSEIYQIQFKWPVPGTPDGSFDVWIDDVYFYKGGSDE